MTTSVNPDAPRVDQFLMAMEARFDRWRALLQAVRSWERSVSQLDPNKGEHQAVTKSFRELLQWEDFFAYPGQTLLKSLEDRIASGDAVRYGSFGSVNQRRAADTLLSVQRRSLGERGTISHKSW